MQLKLAIVERRWGTPHMKNALPHRCDPIHLALPASRAPASKCAMISSHNSARIRNPPKRPEGARIISPKWVNGRFLQLMLIFSCLISSSLSQTVYKIGAIIPTTQPDLKMFLQYTMDKLNSGSFSFPGTSFSIQPIIKQIDPDNAFQTSIQACALLEEGVVAIFAPPGKNAGAAIQSFGDMFEVPIIHYSPEFQSDSTASFYINLYPHYSTINKIMLDIVQYYTWDTFSILYETEEGLRQMGDLMRLQDTKNSSFTAWKVRVGNSQEDQEKLIQTLKQFRNTRKRIIVDCQPVTLISLLNTMKDLQMLTEYHHYIFTSFELTEYYLGNYTQGDMNITVFKLIDYDSLYYEGLANRFKIDRADQLATLPITYTRNYTVSLQMALLYDAVYVLQKGLIQLQNAAVVTPRSMSCKNPQMGWENGLSLMNYLRMVSIQGITGNIAVNGLGQRENVLATIIEKRDNVPTDVGNWTNKGRINITESNQIGNAKSLLSNKTIRVTTILSAPFTQLKETDDPLSGNDRYEGYCIDLLNFMAQYLEDWGIEFNYVIQEVADGRYGNQQKDSPEGKWDGMVGELMENKADLAVAPLTINYLRQDAIDFSTPFMNLGISILYRMQESKTPSIFSFLKPLHYDIWMYLIVSYIAISMVLFIMARFTPYEWYRPNEDSDEVENQFTLINSLWFSAGAMMQQGSEISPRALSTRIISGTWWFFVLICIASYTANLAAFLTVTRMEAPIKDAEGLSQQNKIKYGTVNGGSTMTFFRDSDIATYSRMWQTMSNDPNVFVDSTNQGIQRVMQEDYAFLMESVMIEYEVSQKCNLTQIGSTLDSKYYGIGLQKNSPYTPLISKAILQMQDEGVLVKLKRRWWEEDSKCVNSQSGSGADDASSLKLDSIGGIFYVLIFGTLLGCAIAVLEFIWKSKKNASREKLPLWREMLNELAFAFRCRDSSSVLSRPRAQINFKSLPSSEAFEGVNIPRMNNTNYIPAATLPTHMSSSAAPLGGGFPNQNHISTYPRNNVHNSGFPDQVDFYTPVSPAPSSTAPYATYRPYAYQTQQQNNPQGGVATSPHPSQAPPALKFVETPSILKNPNPSNSYVRVDTKV